jgi:hypothetical protein
MAGARSLAPIAKSLGNLATQIIAGTRAPIDLSQQNKQNIALVVGESAPYTSPTDPLQTKYIGAPSPRSSPLDQILHGELQLIGITAPFVLPSLAPAVGASISTIAGKVIPTLTGGLPPWVSLTRSLTQGPAFSTAQSQALKTFLAGQLQHLLQIAPSVSRLDMTSRASYLGRVRALYRLYTQIR